MFKIVHKIGGPTLVLFILFYLHGVGLFLFIRGFLLSRTSLSYVAECNPTTLCTLPPTHGKVIIFIIDALRFDFISPVSPVPKDPFHHGILTLPAELTDKYPANSLIFHAYSDPPTTTLQRIKGITTGSLPTFVEMGSNFGGSEIEEDSIIRQLTLHGKRGAFMGDDTWMLVFPTSFESNMTHPFDSFNVEDLHTVDEGVIANIFPLLEGENKTSWDFIVAHCLGVDHVGHRLGPSHPMMKTKLQQMDSVLRRVVDLMDNDTLLVLLGDHGMDLRGDHGGDSTHETSSGLWMYSKSVPLSSPLASVSPYIPWSLRQEFVYPGMERPWRSIQQIDLVPTLSLLLGVPIPFNNLGTIIPELFIRDKGDGNENKPNAKVNSLDSALRMNVKQIQTYIRAYSLGSSGSELSLYSEHLAQLFADALDSPPHNLNGLVQYTRTALNICRQLWAQFDALLMTLGLGVISGGVLLTLVTSASIGKWRQDAWEDNLREWCRVTIRGALAAAVIGLGASLMTEGIAKLHITLFTSAVGAIISGIYLGRRGAPMLPPFSFWSTGTVLLHSGSFFSNSFVFWEDRTVPVLLTAFILSHLPSAFRLHSLQKQLIPHQTQRHRNRILGFSLLSALCIRFISISSVCREEQQPYCNVTFYASSSIAAPPLVMVLIGFLSAFLLPDILLRFLRVSKSDGGPASLYLRGLVGSFLVSGSACWALEYCETISILDGEWNTLLRIVRTVLGRFTFGGILLVGGYIWRIMGLCLSVEKDGRMMKILGFANIFGSTYLLLYATFLGLAWLATQLTGQVVLCLTTVTLLSWLELMDSIRDTRKLASPSPSHTSRAYVQFTDVVPLALLGMLAYFATGHQATLQSLQWKTAFVLSETVTYPWSPLLVILNTFASQLLLGLAVPLVAMWNIVDPPPHPSQSSIVTRNSLIAALHMMNYYALLLLGSAASAGWLRRHLMVWKVFAPRFMLGASQLLVIDVGLLLGMGWGVGVVGQKVRTLLEKLRTSS